MGWFGVKSEDSRMSAQDRTQEGQDRTQGQTCAAKRARASSRRPLSFPSSCFCCSGRRLWPCVRCYIVLTNAAREGARFASLDFPLEEPEILQLVVDDVVGSGTNISTMPQFATSTSLWRAPRRS